MAVTVNALMEELKETYQLTWMAGKENGEHVVTWVHLMEDASVAELFIGNELVVTSGYGARDEEALLRFTEEVISRPVAAQVFKEGKYILDVPKSVMELCDAYGLPLLTMPWEMSATEFVKSCCIKIEKQTLEMEKVSRAAMHALQSPNNPAGYMAELGEFFDEAAGFQILVIHVSIPEDDRRRHINRTSLRIHTALYRWGYQFLLFQMDQRFVLILNQDDRAVTDEVAEHIHHVYTRRDFVEYTPYIGIGEPVAQFSALAKSYHSALSAVRRGLQLETPLYRFCDMGFYKLLYSIPDDALLAEYYEQRLAPLLAYDAAHDGVYVETLFRYLLSGGSLVAVAEQMYTHRNTVHYRIGKIKELLDNELATSAERFPLLLAFHAGVILGKIEDYEKDMVTA